MLDTAVGGDVYVDCHAQCDEVKLVNALHNGSSQRTICPQAFEKG